MRPSLFAVAALTARLAPRTAPPLLLSNEVVGLLGIADDTNSSFMQGPAQAPPLIREAIASDSANPYCELGIASASAF